MKWLADARVIHHPKGHAYETQYNWVVTWKSKLPGKRSKLTREKGPGFCREIHARFMLFRFLCAGRKVMWTRKELILQTESEGSKETVKALPGWLDDAIRVHKIPVPEEGDPDFEAEPEVTDPVEWGSMDDGSDDE